MPEKNTIILNIIYLGETCQVQTYQNQYHSLMALIADNLAAPGFGLCCGMGNCGTCLVHLHSKFNPIKKTVLSCAVQVNDELANSYITLPDRCY